MTIYQNQLLMDQRHDEGPETVEEKNRDNIEGDKLQARTF